MYIIERDSDENYGFVVCNTGAGLQFHPSTLTEEFPKQKVSVV
jgi:hypothetical protein